MTLTENKPEEVAAATAEPPPAVEAPPQRPVGGFAGVIGTADHKVVGRLYLGFSLLFAVAALVLGALFTAEGVDATTLGPLTENTFFQVFTLAHFGIVFLGILPALVGLATYIVPLQVGSPDIAFPRTAAAAFWTWLLGSVLLIAGYLINGGPAGGDVDGVLLSFIALAVVIAALLASTACVVATVATARAPGMTLLRVPAFSWAMLVAGSVWLLNLGALVGNLIVVYVDVDNAQVLYGIPGNHWPQLAWIFAPPAIFTVLIPVLGIAGDVVPVMSRRRLDRYPVVLVAIGAFGVLSFGAWAQTAFYPELVRRAPYVIGSLALILPVLALLGGFADTARRGRVRLSAALLFALSALLLTLVAALAAGAHAISGFNLTGTMWASAITKLVVGAGLAGIGAGLFYWGSKVWGRLVSEPIGRLAALVVLAGAVLYGGADLISGIVGQRALPPTGIPEVVESGFEIASAVGAVGAGLLVLGVLLIILGNLPALLGSATAAHADPWEGHTLEWATTSPPPYGNFLAPVPEVSSEAPMLDVRTADRPAEEGA